MAKQPIRLSDFSIPCGTGLCGMAVSRFTHISVILITEILMCDVYNEYSMTLSKIC